jgi:hypothetical protein
MAFGQDFLKAFFGNDYVKDYRHASKTFTSNGYENAPRLKFAFHVYFNINQDVRLLQNIFQDQSTSTIGLLVKNIDLPRYKIDTETLNQYNRKRVIQKKIEYQPVRCALHDDGGDLIRTMWYNYFAYYYKDPNQMYGGQTNTNGSIGNSANRTSGFSYNDRDIYRNDRLVNDWGYIGESYTDGTNPAGGKPAFFRDIQIFGFNQHKFVQYVLINPMISEWNHDTYNYSEDAGTMENTLTIDYETVKYYSGGIGAARPDTNVTGFADPNYYDTERSPLSRPGGTRSILGQGGLLDTGIGIYEDLQAGGVAGIIGAVQKAGTAYQTFRTTNVGQVARDEAIAGAKGVLRNTIPGAVRNQPNGRANSPLQAPIFPTPPRVK